MFIQLVSPKGEVTYINKAFNWGKKSRNININIYMAIASLGEQDACAPQVILAVLQAQACALPDLEKQMKSKEFVILQQRKLDLSTDQAAHWFPKTAKEDDSVEYFGFVLQRRDAQSAWKDLAAKINSAACGACDPFDEELRIFFPSAVVDQYLLDPAVTMEYLNQIKPRIINALQQLCAENSQDPVQRLAHFLGTEESVITG